MKRTILSACLVLAYLALFNCYIYLLCNGMLNPTERRLWYYFITAGMTIFSWIDLKTVTTNWYHIQFNNIAFSVLCLNYFLNIANHIGLLGSDAPAMFISFNGLIFVVTLLILLSGGRHGYFKQNNEND